MSKFILFILLLVVMVCSDLFASNESSKTVWHRKYKKILKKDPLSVKERVEHLLHADTELLSVQQKIQQQTADLQSSLSATDFECQIARLLYKGSIFLDQLDHFNPKVRADVVVSLSEQYAREAEIFSQKAPTAMHTDEVLATQRRIDGLTDRILRYEENLTKKEKRYLRMVAAGKKSQFQLPSSLSYLRFDVDFHTNCKNLKECIKEKKKLAFLLKVSIGLNASNKEIVDCYSRCHRRFFRRGLLFLRRSMHRLCLNGIQRTVFDGVMYRNRLYETIFPHPTGWSSKGNIHTDLINFLQKNKDPAYWVRNTFGVKCEQYNLQKIIYAITACVLDFEISETSSRYNNSQVRKEIQTIKTHFDACCNELQSFGISLYEFQNAEHEETEE